MLATRLGDNFDFESIFYYAFHFLRLHSPPHYVSYSKMALVPLTSIKRLDSKLWNHPCIEFAEIYELVPSLRVHPRGRSATF